MLHVLRLSLWFVADSFHVSTQLGWHFFEHFFSEVTTEHALVELDKLDDIANAGSSAIVSEHSVVAVEFLHGFEVSTADTHDND